jgi:hypothetical protein
MREKIVRFVAWLVGYKLPGKQLHYITTTVRTRVVRVKEVVPDFIPAEEHKKIVASRIAEQLLNEDSAVSLVVTKEGVKDHEFVLDGTLKYIPYE